MAAVPKANTSALFDLKSAALTLVSVVLKTSDLAALAHELEARFGDAPGLFDKDPVVVDLSALREELTPLDFPALLALLRHYKMQPVAAKGGNSLQMEEALAAGLSEAPDIVSPVAPRVETVVQEVFTEVEVVREVQGAAATTLVVDKPLRSGQQVYARGGDLIVMAVVSFGAEVIADGNIHVYAPLRGRAIAGARGNTEARIFAACMEAQLVSIAGIYRTTETPLAADVLGKPAQVRLDGEKLLVEPLKF